MQRRPLEPLPRDEDEFLTPLQRIMSIFHQYAARDFEAICVDPIFHAQNYNVLFAMLGFEEVPVHPKKQKKEVYPKVAPDGAHPTGFLQFGVQMLRKSHVVFELGDHTRIVRFDLKEDWPEVMGDEPRYQIDEIRIWDGGEEYNLDCEDDFYRAQMDQTINVVRDVIQSMWDRRYDDAVKAFEGLTPMIRELDEISQKLDAEHMAEFLELQKRVDEMPSNTP